MADGNGKSCPIDGNSDLYGLGVRLGLYLQFIALVLARPSVRLAFKAINSSTIAFILANFIVLIQQSASRTLFAPEAYLLFFLLVPQLVVNIIGTDLWKGVVDFRGAIAILLWGSFCYYFSWYWWLGLDLLPMSGCEDEFGFFFTKVSLRGWFRTFNKVIWTISDVAFGIMILLMLVQTLVLFLVRRFLRKKAQEEREIQGPVPPSLSAADNQNIDEATLQAFTASRPTGRSFVVQNILQHIFLQGWSLLPFAIFVTGAEVTIRYNNIRGVNTVDSASQLVPLVLALGLLVHVFGNTVLKLGHGFRHAFDEDTAAHAGGSDDEDRSSVRSEFRRELREERGWLGVIGRFLFRLYCAFVVGYNQDEEEKPSESNPATDCPKRRQCSGQEIELEGGARP